METKHGNKKKIAAWLGIKQSFFSAIIIGRRRPGPAHAKRLAKISGIAFENWLIMPANKLRDSIFKVWEEKNK